MCYNDDTIVGCPYHACTVLPEGMDTDGNYCPSNPCYHDDTIEGCPNWACILDNTGFDPHEPNGYCPGNFCYNDDTIYGCPNYVPPMCDTDPEGLNEAGEFCPQHVCAMPETMYVTDWCPTFVPPEVDPNCVFGYDEFYWGT